MPIYEFACDKCKHRFEQLVASMSTRKSPPCPQCQGKTSRQMSVFAAHSGTSDAPCGPGGQACQMNMAGGCPGGGCPMANR